MTEEEFLNLLDLLREVIAEVEAEYTDYDLEEINAERL